MSFEEKKKKRKVTQSVLFSLTKGYCEIMENVVSVPTFWHRGLKISVKP